MARRRGRGRRLLRPLQRAPTQQTGEMASLFPGLKPRTGRDQSVSWEGQLRPTPDSPAYTIRIDYQTRSRPKVYVIDPPLVLEARHLHRYDSEGGRLCLYWPDEWIWRPSESLAQTIVPWTALWLYYYELWLVTGDWLGPSSPHQVSTPKETEIV